MERKFSDQELIRRDKLKKLQEENRNPYEVEIVNRTFTLEQFNKEFSQFSKDELHNNTSQKIQLVGRVMSIRQTFGVIKDFSGQTQFYINKKNVDESVFKKFKEIDIGDIITISGVAMKTNTGEVTLNVSDISIISKSLKVLPEKFHGLVDEEIRARNRYVDLIVNQESMDTFINRSLIIKSIRNYMDGNGFFEVETPVLNPILGGAAAKPFITHHNALDIDLYLRIAPETYLKRAVVGGFTKVFEIARCFRNEGIDATHLQDFTMIEGYAAFYNYKDNMKFLREMHV